MDTPTSNGRATVRDVIDLLHRQDETWNHRFERLEDQIDVRFKEHTDQHADKSKSYVDWTQWLIPGIVSSMLNLAMVAVMILR